MTQFNFKEHYDVQDLLEIVRLLRSPSGCPWDREQDHRSIRKNLIEETYEAAEAIDLGDAALLREELGDVLLQVALHAQMEEEAGRFSFHDVCDGICQKLVERHPHVFGDVHVEGSGEVLRNWDAIKERSKGQTDVAQTLESVPKTLPALMRAEKVQARAEKVGVTYPDISWAMGELKNEIGELQEAVEREDVSDQAAELGDMLFAAVNVSRFLQADPEQALNGSTQRFMTRFAIAERLARERGIDLKTCTAEAFDELWRVAKGE